VNRNWRWDELVMRIRSSSFIYSKILSQPYVRGHNYQTWYTRLSLDHWCKWCIQRVHYLCCWAVNNYVIRLYIAELVLKLSSVKTPRWATLWMMWTIRSSWSPNHSYWSTSQIRLIIKKSRDSMHFYLCIKWLHVILAVEKRWNLMYR